MAGEATGQTPVLLMAQQLTQGGSERQLTEIAKSLDRSRFAPRAAVFRPSGYRLDELRAAGVPVECFPLRSFASADVWRAGWQLGRYLRRHRVRIVHTFDLPANVFGVPVARAWRTPIVISSQRAFRDLAPGPYRRLLRFTDRLADATVVNCRALEHHMIHDEGASAGKLRLCYNGIDTATFHPGGRTPPEGPPVVGVVCALRPEKGLPTLVEAFARARAAQPGLRLRIIGSGPLLPRLQELAAGLGLAAAVEFAPSTAQVAEWLRTIDIFVLPSLSEALSNSLMEAMACGCAAIASRVGGNPELVEHERRGLLFRAGDAEDLAAQIQRLGADESLRRGLAAEGCRFIHENFPLAAAARRMAEIYSELQERRCA